MKSQAASLVSNPKLYVAWSLIVVAALGVSFFNDPYIFGFSAFLLAAVSILVGLLGLSVVLFSKSVGRSAKAFIVAALVLTAAAIVVALATLSTFKWA